MYSRNFKRIAPIVLASLMAGLLPAMAAPETISIALPGDVPGLDPSKDSSPIGFNYRLNVFDQLTELQRDGEMVPRLAESWSFSEDLTEWTFKLRQDVKFHNGAPFAAKDVVFTVNKILADEKTPVRTYVALVKSVEAVDEYTVKFVLTQPYSIFHRQISYVSLMSEDYYNEVGDAGYASAPVGTGPYRVAEWIADDKLELQAFEDYWRGAPEIKTALFRPMPSEASRGVALMSGEIDLVPTLSPALINQLQSASGITVETVPSFRTVFMGFNVQDTPLADPLLREAVDKAIDRKAITERLLRGLGEPAGIMVPPNNIGFDASLLPVEHDLEAAKALVAQSSYAGETISIEYPSNNITMANEVVQAISGYLGEAGIATEIKPMEFTAFFPLWVQTKLEDAYFFAFGSSQYHAESALVAMYEEGSRAYAFNPEIDAIVDEQRTVTDEARKAELLSRAFTLSNQDRYQIPVYHEWQAYGVREGIEYEAWPDGFVRLYDFP